MHIPPDAPAIEAEHWGFAIRNAVRRYEAEHPVDRSGQRATVTRRLGVLVVPPDRQRPMIGRDLHQRHFLTLKGAVKAVEANACYEFAVEAARILKSGPRYSEPRYHAFWEAAIAEAGRRGLQRPNAEVLVVAAEVLHLIDAESDQADNPERQRA